MSTKKRSSISTLFLESSCEMVSAGNVLFRTDEQDRSDVAFELAAFFSSLSSKYA